MDSSGSQPPDSFSVTSHESTLSSDFVLVRSDGMDIPTTAGELHKVDCADI